MRTILGRWLNALTTSMTAPLMRSVLEGLLQHPPDLRRVPARQIPEARGGRKLAEVAQQLLASE